MTNPHYAAEMPVRLYESEASVATVAAKHRLDPADIVDFSLNINPFGPPASAVTAAASALASCNEYPDLRLGALRRVLASRHDVAEDAILFGAGLDDVIKLLIHALTSEGGPVLVHLPTFPRYELEARLRGAPVVLVENDPPWTIDMAGIESALAREAIELAFLCTPNNPTGETIAPEKIAALAAAFPRTVFVVDEALIYPQSAGTLPHVRGAANVIVLRTFSKYFGLAGMRIGYAIGPAALLGIVERGRPPFNATHAAEAAAVAVVEDARFVADCRTTFDAESERFCAALAALPAYRVRGRHANMVLIELAGKPIGEVVDGLAARGIIVADAACFGGLGAHEAIRVSLRGPTVNDRLLAALKEIG